MNIKYFVWGLGGLIVGLFITSSVVSKPVSLGSVAQSHEYQSTTTSLGRFATGPTILKTGSGVLGSVVVTGAAAGPIYFYDATTTNVLLRTNQPATSSIIRATLPASIVAGTYTFDVNYVNGLIVEMQGTIPTTTITYR